MSGETPSIEGKLDTESGTEEEVTLLTSPVDGVPPVIIDAEALDQAVEALRAGTGPIAVDAERAHGFRYSQRAYLIQLRRDGSGTHLIDPIAFGMPADFSALAEAIGDAEWIIHAASQDLPCLAEIQLLPRTLFDTELAARLLGYPRVALGTMLEELFGVRLLKEHSASDWSARPLPDEWLVYAALDVEMMVELRRELGAQLEQAGKSEWARQEFAALAAGAAIPTEPRPDQWRRTSGMHHVRTRRGLAVVQELWQARDELAQRLDRAPGKILQDSAITALAAVPKPGRSDLRQIPGFLRRQAKRFEANWLAAVEKAMALRDADLPPMHIRTEGPPQPRMWAAKDPVAAERLGRVRTAVSDRAEALQLPVENLLTPDYLRRLCWRPPTEISPKSVDAMLAELGARAWQREIIVPLVTPLL